MTETAYRVLLIFIAVPYALMILMLLWNVFGPALQSWWARRAGEQDTHRRRNGSRHLP